MKRERNIHVMRIGLNLPDISCEAIAIASEKNAVICGYADNADSPNISGEIRVWDLLTAQYSVSQHFSSSIRSLESTSDGIVVVGTDHGEASSWQYDGEWHRLATIHHSVTVVAVACAEERQLACSASRDGVLKVWNYLRDAPLLMTFIDVEPICVGFLDKGQSLCMVDRSGEVHVWHIEGYDEPPGNADRRKTKEGNESSSPIVQQCLDGALHLSRVQELYNRGELGAAKLLLDALPDVPHAEEVQQYWQARLNDQSS
jgi:WD40 repeat protein